MHIRAIEIENFKGFARRQRIELTRINLFFGANSAGKSTVLHALKYLHCVFSGERGSVELLSDSGSDFSLGGYRQAVHNHEVNNEMGFTIEIAADEDDQWLTNSIRDFSCNKLAVSIRLQFTEDDGAFIKEYQIYFEDQLGISITLRPEKNRNNWQWNNEHGRFDFDFRCISNVLRDNGHDEILDDFSAVVYLPSAFPVSHGFWKTKDKSSNSCNSDREEREVLELLREICLASVSLVREQLDGLLSIGPLREIPKPDYSPLRFPPNSRWENGLAAWDTLHWEKESLIDKANEWLGPKRLNTSLLINRHQLVDRDRLIRTDDGQVGAMNHDLAPRIRLTQSNYTGANSLRIQDVGTGISQIIPIIVACLLPETRIIAIEQPELHLHPCLQTALGDLMIAATDAEIHKYEGRKQLLIETHSEHLILRLLRRIRETVDNELPERITGLDKEDVAVHYFMPTEAGVKVTRLRVNDEGEFIDRWPYGFFDERMDELF